MKNLSFILKKNYITKTFPINNFNKKSFRNYDNFIEKFSTKNLISLPNKKKFCSKISNKESDQNIQKYKKESNNYYDINISNELNLNKDNLSLSSKKIPKEKQRKITYDNFKIEISKEFENLSNKLK